MLVVLIVLIISINVKNSSISDCSEGHLWEKNVSFSNTDLPSLDRSIILASVCFWHVRGTCVPARAFHARIARRKAGITLKANEIVLTAIRGFFSGYSLKCLQKKAITIHFFGKKSAPLWGIFNNYKEKLSVPEYRLLHWLSLKLNRQRLKFVMRRPELKIPTLTKWLISPLVRVIIKICKKYLVLKTNSNINIYNETWTSL